MNIGVGHWACSPRERELVTEVLDSGRLSYGPKSKEFEGRFAAAHGSKYGVLSNSGTSSLQVALQSMKELYRWEDGNEVIVPSVTFVATVNIVLHNRMTPVLVDVDPVYYTMDPYKLGRAITNKTRAVIPVHLFGQAAPMQEIRDALEGRHINTVRVIEDSCEAMFATHFGNPVGSMGDIGCFSTYVAHLITTGVGGISITDDPRLAAGMRSLVNHGRDGIFFDDDAEQKEVVSRRFKFESVGHSFRITELEAALGLAQLETAKEMIARRRQNARYLTRGLADLVEYIQLPMVAQGNTHAWMMYPIVLRRGDKWDLCNYLESHGIETREMLPLVGQPVYQDRWRLREYPVAKWINDGGFYIGCHQYLSKQALEHIVSVFHDYTWPESRQNG